VRLDDVAHGLATKCRWAGHTRTYYSVAEHSLRVATLVPEYSKAPLDGGTRLQALLHDAAEAYLGDVPAPLKRRLPRYGEIEERLLAVILEAFDAPPLPLHPAVKWADRELLEAERHHLTALREVYPHAEAPGAAYPPFTPLSWELARQAFRTAVEEAQP